MRMKPFPIIAAVACIMLSLPAIAQNPYESIGKDVKVLTLSNGQFSEFHPNDSLRRVGSVIVNVRTKEIHQFIEQDTLYSEATLDPTIISRWYSLDPLMAKFPSISPYVYAANNPIRFIDVAGKWPGDANLMIMISNAYGGGTVIKEGDWTVIQARTMEEAASLMGQTGFARGSVDNLYIQVHGPGAGLPEGAIYLGAERNAMVDTKALQEYSSGQSNSNTGNLNAFGQILAYMESNVDIVIGACGGGNGEAFGQELTKYISDKMDDKPFNLYLSNADVGFLTSERTDVVDDWIPTFGWTLLSETSTGLDYKTYGGFESVSDRSKNPPPYQVLNLRINRHNPILKDVFDFITQDRTRVKSKPDALPGGKSDPGRTQPTYKR